MAGEPKAFASLSSGLLARKGAARPAMRPQGFGGQIGAGLEDLGWNDMGFEPPKPALSPVRDEEHDAFGEEIPQQPVRNPVGALTPIQSPVHKQQAQISDRLAANVDAEDEHDEEFDESAEPFDPETRTVAEPAAEEIVAQPVPVRRRSTTARSAPGSKAKAAFTLRLDKDRHLKLRLACAMSGRSAQLLVTEAVDQFLAAMRGLDGMAEKAKRKE